MEEEKELNNENENKGKMSKKTKIAIGAVAGVAAVSAIVIPTAVVLSNNSNSDKPRVYVDYNIDGLKDEHLEIEENMKISDLKLKPVEGYTFIGWYKDKECTEPYLSDDAITADSTIYAKYQLAMYMVTFPTGEHFSIDQESQAINYGDEVTFTITYEEGYDNNLQNAVVKANDQVLTPVSEGTYVLSGIKENTIVTIDGVEINKYTATINIDGEIKTATVEYGQKIEDVEGLGLSEENTIGFYTKEEFAKENLYDATLPTSGDLTLYTKMATPDAFTYSGETAIINDGVIDAVMPLKHDGNLLTLVSGRFSTINSVYLTPIIKEIADGAFQNCSTLKTINLENIVSIGESAFEGCESLDIDFSKLPNLQVIESSAFAMSGITEVRFAQTNTIKLYSYAFNACENLKKVYLDSNVDMHYFYSDDTDYSYGVFANCPNLSYVYFNTNNAGDYSIDRSSGKEVVTLQFDNSGVNVEEGIELVVGADITNGDMLANVFERSGSYGIGIMANIGKVVFEEDNNTNSNFVWEAFVSDAKFPERRNYIFSNASEIVIDSQRVLTGILNGNTDDRYILTFIHNVGCSIYLKDSLEGVEQFTDRYVKDNFGIEKQETSDKEGYIQYKVVELTESI